MTLFGPEHFSATGLLKGLLLELALAWSFYRSVWMLFLLLPIAWYFMDEEKRREEDLRQELFRRHFSDGMKAFSAALRAGYAAENAVLYAARECLVLYGEEERITREFERMAQEVRMSRTPEEAFAGLAGRSRLPEAEVFAEVFSVARKSGGNLVRIVADTCQTLEDHIRVQEEIITTLRAKELEQKLLNAIPLGLLLYINLTTPDYFSVMYETWAGRVVMTACLAIYGGAYWLSGRILEAERLR